MWADHLEVERQLDALALAVGAEASPSALESARQRVKALLTLLPQHFAREEGGGYLGRAAEAAPRFQRRARRLLRQHEAFCKAVAALASAVNDDDALARWEAIRANSESLGAELRQHELDENELIREAFMDDLGGRG